MFRRLLSVTRIVRSRGFFVALALVCIAMAGMVWILFCGNPQWSKYIYLFQWRIYEQQPAIPGDYNGTWCEWYSSGKLYRKICCTNGQWQGSFDEWYESGVMSMNATQKNGLSRKVYYDEESYKETELEQYSLNGNWVKIYRKFSNNVLILTRTRVLDANNTLISDVTKREDMGKKGVDVTSQHSTNEKREVSESDKKK